MSDENERSVASSGSVAMLQRRIAELETAIRRLAEQDATLSVCDGAVTVTVTTDATLTDAERDAVETAIVMASTADVYHLTPAAPTYAAILRGLLERLK